MLRESDMLQTLSTLWNYFDPLLGREEVVRKEFRVWEAKNKLIQIQTITLLTGSLYLLFGIVSRFAAPDQILPLMTPLHAVVMPAILFFISYLASRNLWPKLMISLQGVTPIGAALANMLLARHLAFLPEFLPEIYLIIVWTFALSGLNMLQALLSASATVGMVAFFDIINPMPTGLMLTHALWIISSYSFGVVNSAILSKSNKHIFLNAIDLEAARNEAIKASNSRSRFLAAMSHDIRTPMNAVIGTTDLLMNESPRPDQKDNLERLHFASETLLGIINDILDFSKIESGKVTIHRQVADLSRFIKNISSTFEVQARKKRIHFDLETDDRLPGYVLCDTTRLSQILMNLLNNAIKFTESGSVRFRVTKCEEDLILFEVIDTGPGIPKEQHELIFEPFEQVAIGFTRRTGGSGLGLSITRSLVKMMHGEIVLHSKPGEGSRFAVKLPLPAQRGPKPETGPSEGGNEKLRGLKILVVDDYEMNRRLAIRFLDQWGVETTEASSGMEAITKCKQNRFDFILMDIQMPDSSGENTALAIQGIPLPSYPKIIAVTAMVEQEADRARISGNMVDVLIKPYRSNQLKEVLLRNLE